MISIRLLLALAFAFTMCGTSVRAEVTGIQIDRREAFAGGRSFGAIGPYEIVSGRVAFTVDPLSPANAGIADIAIAPRDGKGKVDFTSDFVVLRPVEPKNARPAALLEILNRGTTEENGFFFASTRRGGFRLPELRHQELTDAFAFEQGFTLAYLGWQTDPSGGKMRMIAPLVDVTGPVRGSVITDAQDVHAPSLAFDTPNGECPAHANQPERNLVVKRSFDDRGATVAPSSWRFTTQVDRDGGAVLCAIAVAPIVPDRLYEVTYRGGKTAVAGLSYAAVRDFASYLKGAGNAMPFGNAPLKRVIGFGYSQSARFLRSFLRDGFNAGLDGRIALDGMLISSAGAGGGSFNQRYAMPGEAGTSVLSDLRPVDMFPFADGDELDPVTGAHGGLLDKARSNGSVPKIVTTLSSTEYWARFASLTYTTVDGTAELPIDPNERLYFIAGTPHARSPFPPSKIVRGEQNLHYGNFASAGPALRALLVDLDDWVADETPPPPSAYPHLGGLVSVAALKFPTIPDAPAPAYAPRTWRMDFGPRFSSLGIADNEPPTLGPTYTTLVPQVDADGNDLGGLALPFLAVPLGTYTGWNVDQEPLQSFDYLSGLIGSFMPFARSEKERLASHDSRLSIEERYGSRQVYLDQTLAAARALVARRLMLGRDVQSQVELAAQQWDTLEKP
jgi:hypothetical protein